MITCIDCGASFKKRGKRGKLPTLCPRCRTIHHRKNTHRSKRATYSIGPDGLKISACELCGNPTNRPAHSKYCAKCAEAHTKERMALYMSSNSSRIRALNRKRYEEKESKRILAFRFPVYAYCQICNNRFQRRSNTLTCCKEHGDILAKIRSACRVRDFSKRVYTPEQMERRKANTKRRYWGLKSVRDEMKLYSRARDRRDIFKKVMADLCSGGPIQAWSTPAPR